MSGKRYIFPSPLVEGTIQSRPNRFVMMVKVDGKVQACHCPSTGRIGSLIFEDIPCLLSRGGSDARKTAYTVEAISLDQPSARKKRWIGINQGKANAYVEFFLREGLMPGIFGPVKSLKREVKLGDSRIDFLINGRDYLEVKTPLKDIPCEGHPKYKKGTTKFNGLERLVKHFCDISGSIERGSKAVILMCYMFEAVPFCVPGEPEPAIVDAARNAALKGMGHWQSNLRIDETGIELLRYFELRLF
ncbi:MAG TPA: DNA/RNA nuclease SfsA [Methanocella sp.]|uniref:DNA/RNA nuclease SfsA n=1 Tax=Methanocella sp. TaxID=2052833 RepID=UPI002CDC41CB|nr:DNA/RNA nuclease SfsA [Methanocella sp.]HTY92126.1 DNA/RNA nuclease SfsA [Methanocella sp.]